MNDLSSALTKTIPISNFNKGMAGKIFKDVKDNGAKVVIKNNSPECVLISPDEYLRLIEEIENLQLSMIAKEREEKIKPDNLLTEEEVLKQLGISNEELEKAKVDIEWTGQ